jgi:hypothetical protein
MKMKHLKAARGVAFCLILCLLISAMQCVALASGNADAATTAWNNVIDFIIPWIQRLGGVIMLVGGVMVGMGFMNDDAERKTRGFQVIVSGAIVIAVAVGSDIFLQ